MEDLEFIQQLEERYVKAVKREVAEKLLEAYTLKKKVRAPPDCRAWPGGCRGPNARIQLTAASLSLYGRGAAAAAVVQAEREHRAMRLGRQAQQLRMQLAMLRGGRSQLMSSLSPQEQ